jgi:hypothetical protein
MSGACLLSFAAVPGLAGPAIAQTSEDVVIGVLFPLSGANAQVGVEGCGALNHPVQSIFFSSIKRAYVGPCAPDSSKCSERSCGAAR